MNFDQAEHLVAEVDRRDRAQRATRLVELTGLFSDRAVGFYGDVAVSLFEDVKATWLYGYFTGTVLTAYAFCTQQLVGLSRFVLEVPALPVETGALDGLAELCERSGLIDLDMRVRLVALHDRSGMYLQPSSLPYGVELANRAMEGQHFVDDEELLAAARAALECSVRLLYVTPL